MIGWRRDLATGEIKPVELGEYTSAIAQHQDLPLEEVERRLAANETLETWLAAYSVVRPS